MALELASLRQMHLPGVAVEAAATGAVAAIWGGMGGGHGGHVWRRLSVVAALAAALSGHFAGVGHGGTSGGSTVGAPDCATFSAAGVGYGSGPRLF